MITSRFPLGDVSFSAEYFSTLVGEATKQCYGVAAMAPRDLTDRVRSAVRGMGGPGGDMGGGAPGGPDGNGGPGGSNGGSGRRSQ